MPDRLPLALATALLTLAGLLGVLVAGCGGSEPAAPEPADGEVAVEQVGFDTPDAARAYTPSLSGPLRVVSTAPAGPLRTLRDPRQPLSVTFSRSMVPLGEAPAPPTGALAIEPAVAGSLRWEGTQTLVFTPAAPLPLGTAFEATLRPDGLTALDGQALGAPVTWSFQTPRVRLLRATPRDGYDYLDPTADPTVRLRFSQPVEARTARSFIEVDRRRAAAVRNDGDSTLVVGLGSGRASGSTVTVTVENGLPAATGGNLGMENSEVLRYAVRPAPRLTEVDQPGRYGGGDFDPGRGVTLRFNVPVRFEALRQAVRFEPAVELPAGLEAQDDNERTSHTLPVRLAPETRYTVTLRGLTDVFGQPFDAETARFRTAAYEPSVRMGRGLMVIEADEAPVIPVGVTNVDGVRLGLDRLTLDTLIPALKTYDTGHYYGRAAEAQPEREAVAADRRWRLDAARNVPTLVPLRLDSVLTGGAGLVGVRLLRPDAESRYAREQRALAQVTRLGVTAKFSPRDNLVFVTDLATGQPVGGATVQIRGIRNAVRWEGTTGRDGLAASPGWAALGIEKPGRYDPPVQYALVQKGADVAFTSSLFHDGLEPYRFGVSYDWSPDAQQQAGSVFTDRGLYQAGQTVHLKAVLRAVGETTWEPLRDSVRAVVRSPRDEVVFDERLVLSDLGTLDFTWTAPRDAALGVYTVNVGGTDLGSARAYERRPVARGRFRVDAFRRATFAVEATSAADAYVAGDYFEGRVTARYLFGAGMAGQPADLDLVRRPGAFRPPGYDGFRFGPLGTGRLYDRLATRETTLDTASTATLRARVPGNDDGAPADLVFRATVASPARQTLSAERRVTLHPARFYVGLRPSTSFLRLQQDSVLTLDALTVDPGGALVGGKQVTVEVVRQEWDSVREIGSDGRLRWRSERTEEVTHATTVTTAAGRATRLTLTLRRGGSYRLRATATDLRGNTVVTETYLYATGRGYVAWERGEDDRIGLVPAKTDYAPGETARIMIPSPYEEATALITLEREGIIESRVERVTGSTPTIEVPLTDVHIPNVFVSVILLSGRTAAPSATADPGAPGFKVGYASLRVDPDTRHLRVEVEPARATYGPGEEVTVNLRLRTAAGEGVPGEIAFSAADAGVLDLVGYALPDLFETFYGPRALAVTTAESRGYLVEQRSYGQKAADVGGGGGGGDGFQLREDFRPLAHWAPAIRTDRQGRATVTFRLPESLTTFRLMATGLTADAFGQGQTDVVVTKPLVLTQALPRFARLGDTFEAGVLVSNRTGAPGTVTVEARVEAGGLALDGPPTQTVSVAADGTEEVRFRWRASTADTARVQFRAVLRGPSGEERDAFARTLPLAPPSAKRVAATFASTDGTRQEALRLPAERLPGLGGLDAELSSTALVGLGGATRYLFGYPYGCLEQRTSRIRPLLAGDDLLETFDLAALAGGDRAAVIQDWMDRLPAYWTGDGFALWTGSDHASPYVTGYVVLALAEARARGFDPPQPLTGQAVDALARLVRNRSAKPRYYSADVWAATRAQMLHALARHGRVLEAELRALADAPPASIDGLSHLLRAVVAADRPAFAPDATALARRLRSRVRVEATTAYLDRPDDAAYGWIFASDTRATAVGLAALLEAGAPDGFRDLAQRMVRYLMAQRQGGHWASTQDNAAVVEAFAAYARAYEAATPAFTARLKLAGRAVAEARFEGRSLAVRKARVEADALPRARTLPLTIEKDGTGLVYYSLRAVTYTDAPQDALAQGLTVERRLTRLTPEGEPAGPETVTGNRTITLAPGDLVRVRLRLVSPTARNYVVVDDALPAGLEPVNAAFATSDQGALEAAGAGSDPWWGSFNHTEMRDDRVLLFADYLRRGEHTYTYVARAATPGTFVHPPAEAELMYAPATRGRTATGTLVVEPSPVAGR